MPKPPYPGAIIAPYGRTRAHLLDHRARTGIRVLGLSTFGRTLRSGQRSVTWSIWRSASP